MFVLAGENVGERDGRGREADALNDARQDLGA